MTGRVRGTLCPPRSKEPVGFKLLRWRRASKVRGHAPRLVGRLPDALLEALQLSHLPDAPNQRVAVVGHRPQVAERMSRFAGDEELLATRRCDFELAELIHEGLGKIVGHDRFIKVQHGLYLLCCGVERSISDDLT